MWERESFQLECQPGGLHHVLSPLPQSLRQITQVPIDGRANYRTSTENKSSHEAYLK